MSKTFDNKNTKFLYFQNFNLSKFGKNFIRNTNNFEKIKNWEKEKVLKKRKNLPRRGRKVSPLTK